MLQLIEKKYTMPTTLIVPHHIGFILDGNRRFAKLRGLKPWRGHEFGRETVHQLLDWCYEFGVKELTLYTFSLQNFYRPAREVKKLMDLIEDELTSMLTDPRVHERKVRVRVIGQTELLPDRVQKAVHAIEEATKDYDGFTLNACIAYGGKEEILAAVKKIVKKVAEKMLDAKDINQELFASELLLRSEPDIIIRTGGEHRTSNFLPWQSSYSEWFFIQKLLPELSRDDFQDILNEYAKRERRFGK
jgi:tritrans,polycis-undecaprenyl-diphosphate synthase [geranylgeranyl-diphosphate specific]